MKKKLSILLLCCYLLSLLGTVMPYIADGLAHAFWEQEHLATVHFENGKYHVHIEAKKAAEKSSDSKENRGAADETVTTHTAPAEPISFASVQLPPPQWTIAHDQLPSSIFLSVPALPPWFF